MMMNKTSGPVMRRRFRFDAALVCVLWRGAAEHPPAAQENSGPPAAVAGLMGRRRREKRCVWRAKSRRKERDIFLFFLGRAAEVATFEEEHMVAFGQLGI